MSEPQAERHKLHWLPNALTVSRILLIPVLVWFLLVAGVIRPGFQDGFGTINVTWISWVVALVIFAYCMISDFFDGYLARAWNLTSNFGRMLDPIADKLLVAACLIVLMIIEYGNPFVVIPGLVIIGRDIFVSGIREHAANANIVLSPTKLAKWKTTFEMIAILLFISAHVFMLPLDLSGGAEEPWGLTGPNQYIKVPNQYLIYSFLGTLWLAAILSAYTGLHYFRSAMRKPE